MSRQQYNKLAHHWHNVLTSIVQQAESLARSRQRALPSLYRVIQRNWYGGKDWARRLGQAIRALAPQQNLETKPSTLRYLLNWG